MNLYLNFNTFDWGASYWWHYIFINILASGLSAIVLWSFSIYSQYNWSHGHYCIVFIPRTRHQIRLLPCILYSVHCFTSAFGLWVTWQRQQCCNSVSLRLAEVAIIPSYNGSRLPCHENSSIRAATRLSEQNLIARVWCAKRIVLISGSCRGWRLCSVAFGQVTVLLVPYSRF